MEKPVTKVKWSATLAVFHPIAMISSISSPDPWLLNYPGALALQRSTWGAECIPPVRQAGAVRGWSAWYGVARACTRSANVQIFHTVPPNTDASMQAHVCVRVHVHVRLRVRQYMGATEKHTRMQRDRQRQT